MVKLCNDKSIFLLISYYLLIVSITVRTVHSQFHSDFLRKTGEGPKESDEVFYYQAEEAEPSNENTATMEIQLPNNQPQHQERPQNQSQQTENLKQQKYQQPIQNRIETKNTGNDLSNFRYVVFGTSVSWGSGLEDRKDAFPHLLSPNVKNLALRACGPNYPSVCAQSMVGNEDIYDVVILEYMTGSQDGLYPLARRLRQRFPNAIIVFVCLWYPLMLYSEENDGRRVSIQKWMSTYLGVQDYTSQINDKVLPELEKSNLPWTLDMGFIEKKVKYASDIAREVSGYVLFGPNEWVDFNQITQDYTLKFNNVVHDMIIPQYKLFCTDWLHLSKEGHQLVSQRIQSLLQKTILPNNNNKSTPSSSSSNILGTWGKGDACYSWYETGIDVLKHSDNVKMENFQKSTNAKYSLNFPVNTSCSLLISNPFSEPRRLVISFMSTGPETTIYPITEIQVHNVESGYTSPTIYINPITKDYPHPVHVVQSHVIGDIPPGENKLTIKGIKTSTTTVPFFRIVAVSVTDPDVLPSKNFHGPAALNHV